MSNLNKNDIIEFLKKNLTKSEKQQLIEELGESLIVPYTRDDAIRDINSLPQTKHINEFDMHLWLDSVIENEPDRLKWHVRRLQGIGGSEIGAIWMSKRGIYHPFQSNKDVVESKLLKQAPQVAEGNLLRGSELEDAILRPLFRRLMTKKYAEEGKEIKFRDDLFPLFMEYKDSDKRLSWLVGSPDEIMEVNGEIIIIDYKAPTTKTIASLDGYKENEAPIYYEAQLHHYATIGQKLGLNVSKTMLASYVYDKHDFDLRHVEVRSDFQQELLYDGTEYWENYVCKGIVPTPVKGSTFTREVELEERVMNEIMRYAALSSVMNNAKRERDQIQKGLESNNIEIDPTVDVVQSGAVNLMAKRKWNLESLASTLEGLNIDTSSAWQKNDFDKEKVAEYLENLDQETADSLRIETNGEFQSINEDVLLRIAREVQGLNLGEYVESSSVGLMMNRSLTSKSITIRQALEQFAKTSLKSYVPEAVGLYKEAIKMSDQGLEVKKKKRM